MTNEEILTKAIEKAIKNGYDLGTKKFEVNRDCEIYLDLGNQYEWKDYKAIIFSHDFARAFWGEEPKNWMSEYANKMTSFWEYNLQKMVLEKEPIKYLKKFLLNKER